VVTASGRLGWTDGSGPPEINHAHHPDELLRGDPDPPATKVEARQRQRAEYPEVRCGHTLTSLNRECSVEPARKERRSKLENERILYSACPLCDSADIPPLVKIDCTGHAMWREPLEPFISWLKCGQCEHIFTEGYFTDAALDVLFGDTQRRQVVGTDMELQRNTSAKMVERVVNTLGLPDGRLWLDVGFGNGSLLMTANEFGFDVFGVDLRENNVADIGNYGIPAYHGTLGRAVQNVAFKSKPSVISMADVVEHEPFPRDVLRCARSLINEPGLLLISMPNASAPLWAT